MTTLPGAMSPTMLALGAVGLATLTYLARLVGVALRARTELPEDGRRLAGHAVAVLFCALIATSALLEAGAFAGWARPAGVLVAGLLAWRRLPFLVVVLAAAATTAGLRLVGVP